MGDVLNKIGLRLSLLRFRAGVSARKGGGDEGSVLGLDKMAEQALDSKDGGLLEDNVATGLNQSLIDFFGVGAILFLLGVVGLV